MRLAAYFFITVLVAVGLIVTLAFPPKKTHNTEHFAGYQVYGGGGGIWAPPNGAGGSPQCSDRAIGFQEDTQNPGRYWGWHDDIKQVCAFYNVPKASAPVSGGGAAAPVPSQPQGRQVGAYEQCGGKGGSCAANGQCEDRAWTGVSCPQNAPVCSRVNEWHWQCDAAATGGGSGPGAPGPAPGGGSGVQYRGVGQVCGGKGDDCTKVSGATCVDGPWPNFQCTNGSTCKQKGTGGWYYECMV